MFLLASRILSVPLDKKYHADNLILYFLTNSKYFKKYLTIDARITRKILRDRNTCSPKIQEYRPTRINAVKIDL